MAIDFDPKVYRDNNQDLVASGMSDDELERHFREHGVNEARIFSNTNNQRERFSMAFLRGRGLEVGPGSNPFPLYGDSQLDYADVVDDSHYETSAPIKYSNFEIDSENLLEINPGIQNSYDFVVASHVLEHVNSLGRALMNLSNLACVGGKVYIILPNKEMDWDKFWMQEYGIFHHVVEYYFPKAFLAMHRSRFLKALTKIRSEYEDVLTVGTQFSFESESLAGKDYIFHKHTYSLCGWMFLLNALIKIFNIPLCMVDVASCSVRNDVHFMFAHQDKQ